MSKPVYPDTALPATMVRAENAAFQYQLKSSPADSNLSLLTYGWYLFEPGAASDQLCHPTEEALLFVLDGSVALTLDGDLTMLDLRDVFYIPRGAAYSLKAEGDGPALIAIFKAAADTAHPARHASWEQCRTDESCIRHLKGKDVYIMFDVDQPADRLVAGYTIYEPHTRAFPPHNHTDQEEIYLFADGHGAMEVYPDEENKTFVYSVNPGDAVTIPVLNYHPVFSQDEPVTFIWCIAGERYWVGDKNTDFMKGEDKPLTT